MPSTKTQRLLDLIAYLAGRRFPVSIDQLMQAVPGYAHRWSDGDETARESVRRMFHRDRNELEALGITVTTAPLPGQADADLPHGYVLRRRDFYLPYVRLLGDRHSRRDVDARPGATSPRLTGLPRPFEITEEEAAAALEGLLHLAELPAVPLEEDARSAYGKLTFDLDPARFPRSTVALLPAPGERDTAKCLRVLCEARIRLKRVRFEYEGIQRDARTHRDVAPYGLNYQRGHWYLIGHDALRDAVRTFRVSRMRHLEANASKPGAPDYDVPPDFDLTTYAGLNAWELGGEEDRPKAVRVLFHYPTSLWVARNRLGSFVESRPDGAAVHDFRVLDPDAFLRWILGLEGTAEILLPAELRQAVRKLAARVADLHRDADRV